MNKGKEVNIYTLLDEIDNFNVEIKEILKELYNYVYLTLEWPHKPIRSNRTLLYARIEEILKDIVFSEE